MGKTTLRLLLLTGMLLYSFAACAQDAVVNFAYDACGNRTQRTLYVRIVDDNEKNIENVDEHLDTATGHIGALEISVFPNPTAGKVIVSLSNDPLTSIHYTIATAAGTVLEQSRFSGIRHELDLTTQPAGIYLLRMVADNETCTWKIVKQ